MLNLHVYHLLAAISPHHALLFFRESGLHGILVLGSVFLVVTGGEEENRRVPAGLAHPADDAEAVQAKDSEIEMIFRDMEQSLINRIVRRLSSPDVTSAYHFMSSQPEASSMEEMELLPTRPQAPL